MVSAFQIEANFHPLKVAFLCLTYADFSNQMPIIEHIFEKYISNDND